jgi:hypothetical protein
MKSLRCSLGELIEATFRAALLRHGCSSCEIAGLDIVDRPPHGGEIALASVRAPDGRELFRVYGLGDLDDLLANAQLCQTLAAAVQRLARHARLPRTAA